VFRLMGSTGSFFTMRRLANRQEPWECLISFICSSNNNIARITGMLERLRTTFGSRLAVIGGHAYHAFPTVDQLAAVPEGQLRELGFGYRARFVCETAKQLQVRCVPARFVCSVLAMTPLSHMGLRAARDLEGAHGS